MIQNLETGVTTNTDEINMDNVNIRMKFNNSIGKAKASGATTILEIWK